MTVMAVKPVERVPNAIFMRSVTRARFFPKSEAYMKSEAYIITFVMRLTGKCCLLASSC